jgi:hypothetical protein
MTGGRRPRVPGVSPLRGGSFAASFGRGPYVRGGCRARHPRHRPHPGPAATSPVPHGASWSGPSGIAPGARDAGRKVNSPGRNAAHCPGRPLRRQGRACGASPRRWAQAPTPDPGDLCRPSGPVGEGQAEGQAQKRATNLPRRAMPSSTKHQQRERRIGRPQTRIALTSIPSTRR